MAQIVDIPLCKTLDAVGGDLKLADNGLHFVGKKAHGKYPQIIRYAPEGFGNAADNGSQRVGIGTQADGPADRILKSVALADNPQRYGHGSLTGLVEAVFNVFLPEVYPVAGELCH